MFSTTIDNSARKPSAPNGAIRCCHIQIGRKPQHGWWRNAGGCIGSSTLLLLLPKCPMCIAAYLALWTGASVAMPVATHLRPVLEILFVASAAVLLIRCVAMQMRNNNSMGERNTQPR